MLKRPPFFRREQRSILLRTASPGVTSASIRTCYNDVKKEVMGSRNSGNV